MDTRMAARNQVPVREWMEQSGVKESLLPRWSSSTQYSKPMDGSRSVNPMLSDNLGRCMRRSAGWLPSGGKCNSRLLEVGADIPMAGGQG